MTKTDQKDIQKIRIAWRQSNIYVHLRGDKFVSAHLAGDYMDITSRLSEADRQSLERRALTMKAIREGKI